MNEEKQYLNDQEISPADIPQGSGEFSGPTGYSSEQQFVVNGEVASEESFEFSPDMATEWEMLNPEEKADALGLITETVALANVSETGNAAAEKAAKLSSLGTAFALAETPDEEVSVEGVAEEPSFWKRTINTIYETAGKGARAAAIAATLGVATLAPMKSAQAGFFDQMGGVNVQQTINKVDRMMRGKQELQGINQQQENLRMRIDQLDREKAELVRRTSADGRVNQIQNVGENKARNIEIDANYKAQKAELKAQRAQAKANFLNNQNHTEVDEARYEANLARIDAQEARIDAQYETNHARENARVQDTSSRIDRDAGNLSDRISQIEMEQQRLQSEIQRLEIQKSQRVWDTTRDIAR